MWPESYPFIWSRVGRRCGCAFTGRRASPASPQFAPGTRVAGEAHRGRGWCTNCLRGRYNICLNYGDEASGHLITASPRKEPTRTYTAVSVRALQRLPEQLSYNECAMLYTAGVALYGVDGALQDRGQCGCCR